MGMDGSKPEKESSASSGCGNFIRLRIEKCSNFAFLSHNDLIRFLNRLCLSANLPVNTTGEYRLICPISSPLPLPLGLEGLTVVLEIEFSEPFEVNFVVDTLNRLAPEGLRFLGGTSMPSESKARAHKIHYSAQIDPTLVPLIRETIEKLPEKTLSLVHRREKTNKIEPLSVLEQIPEGGSGENNLEEWLSNGLSLIKNRTKHRAPNIKNRARMVDLKSIIDHIELSETSNLRVEVNTPDTGTARPDELFELLGLGPWPGNTPFKRVRVDLADEFNELRLEKKRKTTLGVCQ